jgi:membrane-bound metal-dependent hydrolase YbcI (DUF457 family)
MDVISHGLWGGITVGRSSRKSFWIAFLFGVAPDVFAFGPRFVVNLVTQGSEFFRHLGRRPELSEIPDYVFQLYNISHSLVVFAVVFAALWLLRGKPMWEMCAWALHILVDIFTHSLAFFPTPFLWPISDVRFNGHPWSDPMIWFPNVALLICVYAVYFWKRRKAR